VRAAARIRHWGLAGRVCTCLLLALLQACASRSPPVAPPSEPVPAPAAPPPRTDGAAIDQFERRQRDRAELAQRQGRLADARQAWEVLQLLPSAQAEAGRRLAELQQQVQTQLAERLPRAVAAHKRGELDAAAQLYLGVLALQPQHEAAADGLRAVERERNKRNHVGKLARFTLARRPASDPDPAKAAARPAANKPLPRATGDRNEVEHAAMLASQGELDDAIALLQAHLAVQRNDAEARRLLNELLAQQQAQPAAAAAGPGSTRSIEPKRDPKVQKSPAPPR
jgi:hypothetical protein